MPSSGDHSKSKRRKEVAKGTLISVLDIAEKALDGCPVWGPKAAISATLVMLRGIDQTEQNVETLNDLRDYVQEMVRVVLTPILSVKLSDVPDGLMTDINGLNGDLIRLVAEWDIRVSKGSVRRFFSRDKDLRDLVSLGTKLKDAVTAFQASGTARIQLAIEAQRQELAEAKKRDEDLRFAQQQAAVDAETRDGEAKGRDAGLWLAQQSIAADTKKNIEEAARIEQSRLLSTLPRAELASYDSRRSETRPACFEGTRTTVLEKIEAWFTNMANDAPRLFWLNGLAGIGKSTIAQSVANRARARGVLGASFFFSRQDAKLNNPGLVFPEIAFQLAKIRPKFKACIAKALEDDPDIGTKAHALQFSELIANPLARDNSLAGLVIVLDALDECEQRGAADILGLLMSATRLSFPLFVFITSRPEHHIRGVLDAPGTHTKVVLHDIEESIVQGDIEHYVRSQLARIPESLHLDELRSDWVEEKSIQDLLSNCGKLFVYAATVLRFIANDTVLDPKLQLDIILQARPADGSEPHSELDALYLQVLVNATRNTKSRAVLSQFRNVIGTIVLLRDSLPITALAGLIGLSSSNVTSSLAHLHSIILTPPPPNDVPRIYHPSFPDFITDSSRCTDATFFVIPQDHHRRIALCCFTHMGSLKRNMLDITDPSSLNSEIPDFDARMRKSFPPELQYACQHWASHLVQAALDTDEVLVAMRGFLSRSLLGWLEAMSLLGFMPATLESIENVRDWVTKQENHSELFSFLSDIHRFIRGHFDLIKARALHTYYSAMPFTPWSNQVYRTYNEETQDTVHVLQGLPLEWSPHMTLGGHSDCVNSVAFSCDGTKIASGSEDETICMRDSITGALLTTFEGHSDSVASVAFSCDGMKLASGSYDDTVRIWDIASNVHLTTLKGHSDSVNCVAFSCDGAVIASGSDDKTIRIWDTTSGAHLATFKGHSDRVTSVAFSHDGTKLASGSDDETIRLWNPVSGVHLHTLEGHSDCVTSVAFSYDGMKLASGSNDETIYIWDPISGTHLTTFKGHSDTVTSVAFSRDGKKLASGSDDDTIHIWDTTSGAHFTLKGHSDSITSVAFSCDGTKLVSGSDDETTRIWDTTFGVHLTLNGHSDIVTSVALSHDETKLASGSNDKTIRMWDPISGTYLATFKGHSDAVTSVAFSCDGIKLASGSGDKTIRIWDTTTGTHLTTLIGHSDRVTSVAFSHDGIKLASGSDDETIRIWDATSGAHLATLQGHSDHVTSITFSPDGTKLASGSDDEAVYIWDTTTGVRLTILQGHSDSVNSVAFSHDGMKLASGSDDETIRIWDIASGTHLATLKGHSDRVTSVAFSHDGTKLASGSDDETIQIWDTIFSARLATFKGHSDCVTSIAFSRDGGKIVSGSDDETICIWDPSTSAHLTALEVHSESITSVAFSGDGTKLASGSYDTTIRIWDTTSGAHLTTLRGHSNIITSVAISDDGTKLASGSYDKTVRIWSPISGIHLITLEDHSSQITAVTFSYDGMKLASCSDDKTVRVWDTTSGAHLVTLKGHSVTLDFVAFSRNGTRLGACTLPDKSLTIWDMPDSTTIDPHDAIYPNDTDITSSYPNEFPVEELSYELDNHWLVRQSQSERRRICYIPPEYNHEEHAFKWHKQCVAMGCDDGRVLILDLSHHLCQSSHPLDQY